MLPSGPRRCLCDFVHEIENAAIDAPARNRACVLRGWREVWEGGWHSRKSGPSSASHHTALFSAP
jgi:hypothetical protein